MFAVINTGGKQYCVSEGERLRVERLSADVGAELSFDAMLIGGEEGKETLIGTTGAAAGLVRATVCEHGRARKIEVIKFKRRKDYRRTLGHRQQYTTVEIAGIDPAGASTKEAPAEKAPAETASAEKASAEKAPAKTAPAEKSPAKEASAKKASAKKASAKKASAKKASAKKASAKKAPAKKADKEKKDGT